MRHHGQNHLRLDLYGSINISEDHGTSYVYGDRNREIMELVIYMELGMQGDQGASHLYGAKL